LALAVSAATGFGMPMLIEQIVARAKKLLPPSDSYAINARQRDLVASAAAAIGDAARATDWLIVGENLRLARLSLDALTGRAHTEDLLDNIFRAFCIGK
jgi:tRNA modification GTPase